jgi:hypothetical protein
MTATATSRWTEDNKAYLGAALGRLRALVAGEQPPAGAELDEIADRMDRPPALLALAAAFGLSPFERDLLLACAGLELDAGFAAALRQAGEGASLLPLSFGSALALLPGAHWSALAPAASLRRWRLVELPADARLTQAPLRAAERVVHFLAGVQTLDGELEGLITLEEAGAGGLAELTPSYAVLTERAVRAFTSAAPLGSMPLVQLVGRYDPARDIAAATATALGFGLGVLAADDIPAAAPDRERLARLWEREAVLSSLLLLVDASALGDEPHAATNVGRFVDLLASPTLVLAHRPLAGVRRDDVHLAVEPVPVAERLSTWHAVLPDPDPALDIDRIAGQFALSRGDVRSVLGELALREPADETESGRILWDLCRERSRPRLEHLTERLPESRVWSDLVLPEQQKQLLREIAGHARSRHRVFGDWGFAEKSRRGLGLSALFAGPSGTGKTMAAEGLAELLRLDVYRIDLSRVVSKYIGETERNLGRIFEEAEGAGGVILLFDEADALFGKRTEVRDSHDRYANLEVSYLLQRMEAYEGLAILTTNLKSSLDPAFLRRLRFVVSFPFPDLAARTLIWQRAFPAATPTDGLRYDRLARLSVAGGNIHTIALNAAFAAAESGGPVTMARVLAAARSEYAKLERPLTDAETRGWL